MALSTLRTRQFRSSLRRRFPLRDGIGYRQLRRKSPLGLWTAQENTHGLERVIYGVIDGSGFVAAMCHAVGAFRIVTGAVELPVSLFEQSFECRRVTLVHEQIARPLPAEHITGRVTPGCTAVRLVAREKIQKQAGVVEPPPVSLAEPENVPEELLARIALDEKVLARSVLIAEPRGNSHSLDPKSLDVIEKGRHFCRGFPLEQSTVDRHPEASL